MCPPAPVALERGLQQLLSAGRQMLAAYFSQAGLWKLLLTLLPRVRSRGLLVDHVRLPHRAAALGSAPSQESGPKRRSGTRR